MKHERETNSILGTLAVWISRDIFQTEPEQGNTSSPEPFPFKYIRAMTHAQK